MKGTDKGRAFQLFLLLGLATVFAACHTNTDTSTNTNNKINTIGASAENPLFTRLSAAETGIDFANNLTYNEEFNPYTFRNFYNGGGVAVGDINNDGWPDIFFCSNQQSNRLYLNKGDKGSASFQFEDITRQAGLASDQIWSTGVTMADVNGDGLLDIYVCKSGDLKGENRSNTLFINNGDLTFTDRTKAYGLENLGLSTHAVFFDYDKDGDLDMYLLNNSFRSIGKYDLIPGQREIPDPEGGNKLYRNDDNFFTDLTQEAGIYSSKIGFGLGVTIADLNKDGWQDIYVSNDFFEKDYLYINQQDGSFRESTNQYIQELSLNAMGADIADINNDGYPEIYVTDMLPEKEARIKTKTVFENWDKYQFNRKNGYHQQFIRNTLQLNRGNTYSAASSDKEVYFSEIGRLAGVSATDWSWGALIADLDNDGFKDIFVANGIYQDLTDQDYIQYTSNATADIKEKILNQEKNIVRDLIDRIPSEAVSNYAFRNNGDLTFSNQAQAWGLSEPSFSNGAAYADLDNDGDLDLVVNNVNMPCFIYRNQSIEQHPELKYLKVSLEGEGMNRFGIGSQVSLYYKNSKSSNNNNSNNISSSTLSYQEQMPMRGFQSTVDERLNFGLGKTRIIDSLVVRWPDGKVQVLRELIPNQHITLQQREAGERSAARGLVTAKASATAVKASRSAAKDATGSKEASSGAGAAVFSTSRDNYGIDFIHQENEFVDFDRDRLIFHMLSTDGPAMARGDVNGDGLEDLYLCGAKGQTGVLYLQESSGQFTRSNEGVLETDQGSEDTDALFFDADQDGDLDLYVCSGGSEFSPNSTGLIDRLYLNNGKGGFHKSDQILPSFVFESSSSVSAADFDQDGDLDLFVGVRLKPFSYGYPCKGYILENNGSGIFKDVSAKVAPALAKAGMITDGKWFDYDQDGDMDLVIAGEFMPVKIFANEAGQLREVTALAGLSNSNGWWNSLEIADVNGDTYPDIVAGNHGLNSRFQSSEEKPVSMYVSDFDHNGRLEQILTSYNQEASYPMVLRHDLLAALPSLKKKYLRYASYKEQGIEDIFSHEQLQEALRLDMYVQESSVFINGQDGSFRRHSLPLEAQLSPMFGIAVEDFDADGHMDILMGGNFYQAKPEVGIYDASYGAFLKGDGKGGFKTVHQSGFFSKGAVRDMVVLKKDGRKMVMITKNNDDVQIVQYE